LPWTDFFAQELYLTPDDRAKITHHIYLSPPKTKIGPLFVFHHGAGSCGLSFAVTAQHLQKAIPGCGVLSADARGHGETVVGIPDQVSKDAVLDLSLDVLACDLERAVEAAWEKMDWGKDLGVILVGHSLGGAVVTQVAKQARLKAKILGFAVLDVVEGSAMDALQSMQAYLTTRPQVFRTLEEGIEWQYVSCWCFIQCSSGSGS